MARYVLFATLLLSSAGGLHCLPAHQQSHRRLYTLRAPGLTHCHHLVHLVCCLDHMAWHTRLIAAHRFHSTACAAQLSLLPTMSTAPTSLTRL